MCLLGVVRRYIDFLILLVPTPLVLALFLQQHPYCFVYILNIFSFLFMLFWYNIANVAQRTSEIVKKKKSRLCRHGDIIISTSTLTTSLETSTCEVPSDVLLKLLADFVYNNGVVEISLLHVSW